MIRKHLSPIADHPTAAFVAIIRTTRRIGSAGILLAGIFLADVGMVPPGAEEINPAANARQTMVANKDGDGWRVGLFQNTPVSLHWDEKGREALSAELNASFKRRGLLPD